MKENISKRTESKCERVYQIIYVSGSQILVEFVQLTYNILAYTNNIFSCSNSNKLWLGSSGGAPRKAHS